jgi:rod shape-determining protein MreD
MASLLLIAFAFVLVVLQSTLAIVVPMYSFAPNLLLPIAIYLGVSADVQPVRGALTCFVLGYLLDAFCGSRMGLQTFVLTASFLVARGAGVRLFPQGPLFQILLTLLMAIAFGATVLALRAIFEQPGLGVPADLVGEAMTPLLRSAVSTALIGPLVFLGTRRLEAVGVRRREQRTVSN